MRASAALATVSRSVVRASGLRRTRPGRGSTKEVLPWRRCRGRPSVVDPSVSILAHRVPRRGALGQRRPGGPGRPRPAPYPRDGASGRMRQSGASWATSTSTQSSYVLPDGRPLLDEVTFRVGEGAKVALVGPNGTGKTTLLRIVTGDLDAARRRGHAQRRPRRHAPVRRLGARRLARCATCCCRVAPAADPRGRGARSTRAELAMMERDDEPTQMRLRAGAGRLGRRRRLRGTRRSGTSARGRARHPVRAGPVARGAHPVRRRAEAAGPRGAAARPGRGAAARRAGQLPRRARPSAGSRSSCARRPRRCCSSATTASCSTASPPGSSPSSPAPPGRRVWVHPGRFATYHAGPRGPERAARGAAPALGRGARQAQGAGRDVPAEGGVQRRTWPPGYQAAETRLRQVRGGRAARGAAAASRTCGCGSRGGRTGQAGGRSASGSS